MKVLITAMVAFPVQAEIEFNGTREEFAALNPEEQQRLTHEALGQDFVDQNFKFRDGSVTLESVLDADDPDTNPVKLG